MAWSVFKKKTIVSYTIYTFWQRLLYMISLLSYNIALAKPSYCAPRDWFEAYNTQQNQSLKNYLLQESPTFIALQEVPYPKWPLNIISIEHYIPLGSVPSHCGYTTLLIQKSLAQTVKTVFQVGPSVVAILTGKAHTLAVASCHLAPSKANAAARLEQMRAVVHCCKEHADHWIIAGDMNMRTAEDTHIEQLDRLPLTDAWKICGTPNNKWTWNSQKNHYHPPPRHGFMARFDRIYSWPNTLQPKHFRRIGDQPIAKKAHFASDHFGIFAAYSLP